MADEEADHQAFEARLEAALKSRLHHFRENSSSLSLAGIRRLLEEDLGLQKNALDVHKKFVKQFIDKNLHADEDMEAIDSKNLEEKAATKLTSTLEDKDLSEPISSGEAKPEQDSPIKGVLNAENEKVTSSEGNEINENMIKKAIQERAEYIRSQSKTLTLGGARRYLEEELGLVKFALDPFKKFIRLEIEKVIDSGVVLTSVTVSQSSNAARGIKSKGRSSSVDSESDDEDQEEKPKKKSIRRDKAVNVERDKKRKRMEKRNDVSNKKQSKHAKKQLEEDSDGDSDNGGSVSEDDEPKSTTEKHAKKKEASTPAYGKQVEHLKSVIKACGMSIAPTLYKKAKMVPDSKREAFLLKELEGLLLKEGLSKNPSEKEIKEVRKKKERAKELEGIDTSNIIASSRRRSTVSFFPPPRPKKSEESGDGVMSTKKAKDDGKYAAKEEEDDDKEDKEAKEEEDDDKEDKEAKEEEDDDKEAKKKEGDDIKDAKEKDEDDAGEEEVEEVEEEDEEDEDDEDDDDEASQSEEFNDDDEGSD